MNKNTKSFAYHITQNSVVVSEKYFEELIKAAADNQQNRLSAKKYNWLLKALVEFDYTSDQFQTFSLLMKRWNNVKNLDQAVEELVVEESDAEFISRHVTSYD